MSKRKDNTNPDSKIHSDLVDFKAGWLDQIKDLNKQEIQSVNPNQVDVNNIKESDFLSEYGCPVSPRE